MRKNALREFALKANSYPASVSRWLMTMMFRHTVKLAGTAKLDILGSDLKSVTFKVKNRRKVQNHIGSVHAAAMALLAESATGFIVGVNLPGDKLPLIKSMNLKYVKRAQGDMQATAMLTDEQIAYMQSEDKGEMVVAVEVTDENGIEPVICEMCWAWIPHKK